jgi:hypothetical protein
VSYRGVTTDVVEVEADVLFVPVSGPDDGLGDVAWLERATRGEIARARKSAEFKSRLFMCLRRRSWTPAAGRDVWP